MRPDGGWWPVRSSAISFWRGARSCRVVAWWAMEACASAHHWGRKLRALGLDVRLIAASFVTPYRMEGKSGKNDMTDAAAICETASRPHMRFVPIKTAEQQGVMSLHRVREGLKEERTACINRIRGVLGEFGLVFGQSPKVLRAVPGYPLNTYDSLLVLYNFTYIKGAPLWTPSPTLPPAPTWPAPWTGCATTMKP
jgi:transposase